MYFIKSQINTGTLLLDETILHTATLKVPLGDWRNNISKKFLITQKFYNLELLHEWMTSVISLHPYHLICMYINSCYWQLLATILQQNISPQKKKKKIYFRCTHCFLKKTIKSARHIPFRSKLFHILYHHTWHNGIQSSGT